MKKIGKLPTYVGEPQIKTSGNFWPFVLGLGLTFAVLYFLDTRKQNDTI